MMDGKVSRSKRVAKGEREVQSSAALTFSWTSRRLRALSGAYSLVTFKAMDATWWLYVIEHDQALPRGASDD